MTFQASVTKRILLLIFVLLPISIFAQSKQTFIKGKITDAQTNEPIPFANIFFKGTTIGTTSDFDGNYSLKTDKPLDSLSVLVINYKGRSKKIKKGIAQTIDFQLKPTSFDLSLVVVKAGENPAYEIIRKARENKGNFNMNNLDAYEYKSYTKIDISLDKITEKFRNSKTMKPFAPIFDSLQKAAGEHGQVVLPFFITEQLSDVYYLKDPKRQKTIINGNKITGLVIENFQIFEQFIGKAFQEYNFNDNFVNILERSFLSPIGAGSLSFYDYYIQDTIPIDNDSCIELKVKPRNNVDLLFSGKIWISKKNYALRRLDLEILPTANINFIERYKIQQDYEQIKDNQSFVPAKTRVLVDLQDLGDSTAGLIGKFYIANKDFIVNQPKPIKFYQQNLEIDPNSRNKEEEYWQAERRKMITDAESVERSYSVIDSLRKSPRISTIRKAIRILWDGYYNFKYVQLGHWYTMFGYNDVEGFRFQTTLQTNIDWSKKWILKGHLAYGFKDTKLKYNGQVEYFLDRAKWKKIGIRHQYDVERLGIDPDFLESHVFLNWLFIFSSQFGFLQRMSLTDQTRIWYETDHWRGWNSKFIINHKHFQPIGDYTFAWYDDNNNLHSDFRSTDFTFVTSYSAKRVWLVEDNWRFGAESLRGNVWTFKATMGVKDILGSDFNYTKLSLNVQRFWNTGYLGRLDYNITATKVFGKVPYPLANIFQGNEPIFSSEKSYNLMNFFEFAADASVEAIILHHFDGLLFNRIPLLKRLKLREVAGVNVIFSSYDNKNYIRTFDENGNPGGDNPNGLLAPSYNGREMTPFRTMSWEKPYVEISYGIENLFKVVRIQAFHRLNYLDRGPLSDKKVYPFMIKASFMIRL
ncbi:MAG: DUF5686 and carboxypeptidase regulatory-like domain-containing protein [Sphingobacteriia bacterium]|nr:DUF5686 and carboxypeptidase regulatory-like domain-containing protein [Sphingobacteriia bacterium]